jgi:hypothetical protein
VLLRLVLVGSLALGCAVTGVTRTFAATPATSLTIKIQPDRAKPGEAMRYTLRCNPGRGSLPRPGEACVALARIEKPFAPVRRDVACTEIFGGPQSALVTGVYRGRKVWARFRRNDGCQIARWNRLSFLFPVPVGVG